MSTSEKKKLAVLASGNGTNLEAIIEATQASDYPAIVRTVISDQQSAMALERAKRHKIPAIYIDPKKFDSKESYEQMLVVTLKEYKIDLVVLAGFMRILSPFFIRAFQNQILNIHPSLLPQFPGLHAVQKVLDAGATETGCTVHFVDEGIDTGPMVMQEKVLIHTDDTVETLHQRIHEAEHRLYPKAIVAVLCSPHLKKK